MAMYDILKTVIDYQQYDLSKLIDRIDTAWAEAKIDGTQRTELTNYAREHATASSAIDVFKKLEELDARVAALEDATQDTPTEEPPGGNDYPECVAGKWYYNGDKITYGGKKYHCTAPTGQVCVWSPDEYPTYWEEDAQ